jgi:hypothetical protein
MYFTKGLLNAWRKFFKNDNLFRDNSLINIKPEDINFDRPSNIEFINQIQKDISEAARKNRDPNFKPVKIIFWNGNEEKLT